MQKKFFGYLKIGAKSSTAVDETLSFPKQEVTPELIKTVVGKLEDLFMGKSTITGTDVVEISAGLSTEDGAIFEVAAVDVTMSDIQDFVSQIGTALTTTPPIYVPTEPTPEVDATNETNV